MSTNSTLKARFERLGPIRAVSRPLLSADEARIVVLHRTGVLDKPVSVARRLVEAGLTLKQAHVAISRLAAVSWAVCAVAKNADTAILANDLAAMNVQLRVRHTVAVQPDITSFREARNLSQREFADLMGIDLRTLQNWEQGRNRPDPAVLSLMRIFAHAPDVFEEALSEPVI